MRVHADRTGRILQAVPEAYYHRFSSAPAGTTQTVEFPEASNPEVVALLAHQMDELHVEDGALIYQGNPVQLDLVPTEDCIREEMARTAHQKLIAGAYVSGEEFQQALCFLLGRVFGDPE